VKISSGFHVGLSKTIKTAWFWSEYLWLDVWRSEIYNSWLNSSVMTYGTAVKLCRSIINLAPVVHLCRYAHYCYITFCFSLGSLSPQKWSRTAQVIRWKADASSVSFMTFVPCSNDITRNPEVIWEELRRRLSRREWTRLLCVLLAVRCPLSSVVTQPRVRYIHTAVHSATFFLYVRPTLRCHMLSPQNYPFPVGILHWTNAIISEGWLVQTNVPCVQNGPRASMHT